MNDLWTGISILCICLGALCIFVGYFTAVKLSDVLTARSKNALEAEKERTKQKELELEKAKLAAPPRRSGPIDV